MTERTPLMADKLGFFGAVAASLSHELKNVLATINEFAGLLEDLSLAAAKERPLPPERLQRSCERIKNQVGRGSTLIQRLNRFSHSVDEPVAVVRVAEVVGEICDICERFANLAKVRMERDIAEEGATRELDPFALQHAIYLAIRAALSAASERRELTVGWDGARVLVASADPIGEAGERLLQGELMRALSAEIGVTPALEPHQGGERLVLAFS